MPGRSVPAFRRGLNCGQLNSFPKTQFTCLQNRDGDIYVRVLLLERKERSTMMFNKKKNIKKRKIKIERRGTVPGTY